MRELLYLKDDQIKDFIEQIFYAYRETYSDPKKVLKKYSFGTAHHRAIHLIERHEGLTVSDLLSKLKITKQSLNRVLRDLVNNKTILLKKGEIDSRQRQIFLNERGISALDKYITSFFGFKITFTIFVLFVGFIWRTGKIISKFKFFRY